jgi:hypothetical protein
MVAMDDGIRWGFDEYGHDQRLDQRPWAAEAMDAFGFDVWVHHYRPLESIQGNIDAIREIDAWCGERGMTWLLNVEDANWKAGFVDENGRDWYNRDDGRHYFLFPDEVLPALGACEHLQGLLYDEAAHMQGCGNQMAEGIDKPWVYDPEARGDALEDAADAFVEAVSELAALHERHGIALYTEHVFPVMYHGFARAGWIAATKVLKENWSPAYLACAMGAALQYDTPLWVTPDLWGLGGYPGHSVEEYRSALLLAYHLGADAIYTESLTFDHENRGLGSLVHDLGDGYEVTPYGRVTRWFRQAYMPSHPRGYTFRDVRPRVAIVRQEDGCWGQGVSWLPDRLFGHHGWQATTTTEAWLRVWHLLSRGVIPADSLSWHGGSNQGKAHQLFCPLDGVVVYDHHVGAERLRGLEAIFMVGMGVSEETLVAMDEAVQAGAICVTQPHLAPQQVLDGMGEDGILAQGKGRWIVQADPLAPEVRRAMQPILPPADELRYRFGDTRVTIKPIEGDPDRLEVSLS